MNCLEKDRNRRYETANAFAMDVQRYLAGEPVLAAPPSRGYRLRKFTRKHRAALAMTATIALLLATGAVVSTWLAIQAMRATEGERQAGRIAQHRLAQIEKGNEIITSIFTHLDIRKVRAGPDPLEAVLAQRLVAAAEELADESVGDPLIVAQLQNRLGQSLLSLGHPDDALRLLATAHQRRTADLGADHRDTITSLHNLALAHLDTGRLDLAIDMLEQVVARRKEASGVDHVDTYTAVHNLASAYKAVGKPELAIPLWIEILEKRKSQLGVDHPETLVTMNNLAAAYQDARRLDLAQSLGEETLMHMKSKLGLGYQDTIACMNNLAWSYQFAGQLDRAIALFQDLVSTSQTHLGRHHPTTLSNLNNLAVAYKDAGNLDAALPLYKEADSIAYAHELAALAKSLLRQNDWVGAEVALRESHSMLQAKAADAWETFLVQSMLGDALVGQGNYPEAEPLLLDAYEGMKLREDTIPAPSRTKQLQEAVDRLVRLYAKWGRNEDADRWRKMMDDVP